MAVYKLVIEKALADEHEGLAPLVPIEFEADDDDEAVAKVCHPGNPLEITPFDHVTIFDDSDTVIWEQKPSAETVSLLE